MNTIFRAGEGFQVPDGTIVHPILGPVEGIEDISVAMGRIRAQTRSKIHLHPLVNQVTWVLSGKLTVIMKDPGADAPYELHLAEEQGVITQPGTFFQLDNRSGKNCRVLYVVTPAFLFVTGAGGEVIYNDAVVLDDGWDDLAAMDWAVPGLQDAEAARAARQAAWQALQ